MSFDGKRRVVCLELCEYRSFLLFQKLKSDCEQFVRRREEEAAMEVNLNPQFLKSCREEVCTRDCSGISMLLLTLSILFLFVFFFASIQSMR